MGTWGAGSRGYDKNNDAPHNQQAFDASIASNATFFDTAEIYGYGESERLLGRFIKENKDLKEKKLNPIVATKFIPLPWKICQSSLRNCLVASLERMQLDSVDLYQVHGPAFSVRNVEVWAAALADVVEEGLAKCVGVSNYNTNQVQRTFDVLKKRGIPLLTNQIEYSLLHRLPEHSGLIEHCKQLGVTVLAYSPLAMGRLTGKYTAANMPQGNRKFGGCDAEIMVRVNAKLAEVGARYNKTNAQVALNWCIKKGVIPIAGAKTAQQAEDNAGAYGWLMTDEEMQELDAVSLPGHTSFWQGSTQ